MRTQSGSRVSTFWNPTASGFTLIEILMAMFIMALGVVGVMSLFPVGLESTRTAMDSTMTDIIGRTGVAQMQCYMNASEIYDCGTGKPGEPWQYTRFRPPSRSCVLDWVYYDGSNNASKLRYWRQHDCWVSGDQSMNGFYLRFVKGVGAGHIRRIANSDRNYLTVDSSYPSPVNYLPRGLKRNSSKLIVTRYGFPMQWKPVRLAQVRNISGSTITPGNVLDDDQNGTPPLDWSGSEWNGGQYFVLITSGKAKGRLLRLNGGGRNSLRVRTGPVNLEEDGLQVGDTLSVLGCEDVRPCIFPGNLSNMGPEFRETKFNRRFETPPVIPYYTAPVWPEIKKKNVTRTEYTLPSEYSYLCIISTVDSPRPVFPEVGVAKTARVDVIVYRYYARKGNNPGSMEWKPLEEQARAVGFFTGFVPPL